MRALLIAFLSFTLSLTATAQNKSDLWVTVTDDTWNIAHSVQKGETIFMLARRYHVPPAILADANSLSYQDGLKENSTVTVPLGAYNLQTQKPVNMADARALYYKVKPEDNLYRISRHAGVPQRTLMMWNNLQNNEAAPGQKMLVGWVLYDGTQMGIAAGSSTTNVVKAPSQQVVTSKTTIVTPIKPASNTPVIRPDPSVQVVKEPATMPPATSIFPDTGLDTTPVPVVTLKDVFDEQTMQGQNIVWEKGAAAFFSMTTQAKGASVFAFHNKASKGSVIRVKNMNNGRIVYVKVLGPIPLTKQYYGSIIGLSGSAKAALGVRDEKAFCELSYAGY